MASFLNLEDLHYLAKLRENAKCILQKYSLIQNENRYKPFFLQKNVILQWFLHKKTHGHFTILALFQRTSFVNEEVAASAVEAFVEEAAEVMLMERMALEVAEEQVHVVWMGLLVL